MRMRSFFCGGRLDRFKMLYYENDGYLLLYKRLDQGKFHWPRTKEEIRQLSHQQLRWLLEGISIDQPKAIRSGKREFFKGFKRKTFLLIIDLSLFSPAFPFDFW